MNRTVNTFVTRDLVRDIDKKIRKTHYDPWWGRSRYAQPIFEQVDGRFPVSFGEPQEVDFMRRDVEEPPALKFEEDEFRISSASFSSSESEGEEAQKVPTVESYLPTRLISGVETPTVPKDDSEHLQVDKAAEHKLRIEKARQEELEKLAKENQEKEEELEKERRARKETDQFQEAYDGYKHEMWEGEYDTGTKKYPMDTVYQLVRLDTGDRHTLGRHKDLLLDVIKKGVQGLKSYPTKEDLPRQREVYYNKEGNYIIFKPKDVNDTTKDEQEGVTLKQHLTTAVKARQTRRAKPVEKKSEPEPKPETNKKEKIPSHFADAAEAVKEDLKKWEDMSFTDAAYQLLDIQKAVAEKEPKEVNYYTKILGLHAYNQKHPLVAYVKTPEGNDQLAGQGERFSDPSLMDEVKNKYIQAIDVDSFKKLSNAAKTKTALVDKPDQSDKSYNLKLFDLLFDDRMKKDVSEEMLQLPTIYGVPGEIVKKLDGGEPVEIPNPIQGRKPVATIWKITDPDSEYRLFASYLTKAEFNKLVKGTRAKK